MEYIQFRSQALQPLLLSCVDANQLAGSQFKPELVCLRGFLLCIYRSIDQRDLALVFGDSILTSLGQCCRGGGCGCSGLLRSRCAFLLCFNSRFACVQGFRLGYQQLALTLFQAGDKTCTYAGRKLIGVRLFAREQYLLVECLGQVLECFRLLNHHRSGKDSVQHIYLCAEGLDFLACCIKLALSGDQRFVPLTLTGVIRMIAQQSLVLRNRALCVDGA
ncbi:hypothetical protein D3C75_710000 [compost metagenome]